jgi:hypothetical protein
MPHFAKQYIYQLTMETQEKDLPINRFWSESKHSDKKGSS